MDVEGLVKEGNKRGLYNTNKLGPELVAYLHDRAGMLVSLRDEMSEGYQGWLDDAVAALQVATNRCAEAAEALSRQKAAGETMKKALRTIASVTDDDCTCCRLNRGRTDAALTAWNSIEQGDGG